ncbi:hypothetical protein Q4R01_13720 [Morganella morganii]|uniref:hypothetical protein n=1 Tax=Morganella morganii TaxID=582 RepID=UPI001BDA4994|nr:hypothetical protein [Morganella morganii]MBT0407828.1 hypothetical protein [Morganella morganii subsp. morganii]MBT0426226.1 hypothetical protein [Morganella morganii subsp. morganii]MBT0473565.1 hypothetical protein [Morganella morganii subsp. morganii]QWM02493.1 hypothetical protein IZ188_15095 [Morganella morganii subsp. morganii]
MCIHLNLMIFTKIIRGFISTWQSAGVTIITGKTRLSLPLAEEPLILPENITRSPQLRRIP